MSGRSCHNCVYSVCDPEVWLRNAYLGQPLVPRCANHPRFPGRLQDVSGIPCRNYRRKPATPEGDVRLIPMSNGCYAYVDAADYEWLSRYNWYSLNGYAARYENGKNLFMHREIMRPPEGMFVDHADGSRANNCRFNLRVCTRAENMHNTRGQPRSGSMFKGVSYDKSLRKWRAQCRCGGKKSKCIHFDDEVEAARAYDRVAVEYFGEFARLNFPEEWPPERRQQVYAQRDATKKEKVKSKKAKGERQEKKRPSAGATHASPAPGRSKRVQRRKCSTRHASRTTVSKRVTGHRSRVTASKPRTHAGGRRRADRVSRRGAKTRRNT